MFKFIAKIKSIIQALLEKFGKQMMQFNITSSIGQEFTAFI